MWLWSTGRGSRERNKKQMMCLSSQREEGEWCVASGVGRGRDELFHGRFEVLRSDGFVGGGGAEGPRSTASMAGGRWQVVLGGKKRKKRKRRPLIVASSSLVFPDLQLTQCPSNCHIHDCDLVIRVVYGNGYWSRQHQPSPVAIECNTEIRLGKVRYSWKMVSSGLTATAQQAFPGASTH